MRARISGIAIIALVAALGFIPVTDEQYRYFRWAVFPAGFLIGLGIALILGVADVPPDSVRTEAGK